MKIEFSMKRKKLNKPGSCVYACLNNELAVCMWLDKSGLVFRPLFLTFQSKNIFPLLLYLVVNNRLLLFKASVPQGYGQKRKFLLQ